MPDKNCAVVNEAGEVLAVIVADPSDTPHDPATKLIEVPPALYGNLSSGDRYDWLTNTFIPSLPPVPTMNKVEF